MEYNCERCNKTVDKLFAVGNVERTAWLSDENHVQMPQYDYLCSSCALEMLSITTDDLPFTQQDNFEEVELLKEIESQKALMISVSTGGPRIQEKNPEYSERRKKIKALLMRLYLDDPNPFADLWAWYGKWSSGDLPTYQSRRRYVSDLYQPLTDYLNKPATIRLTEPVHLPTGWVKVDRLIDATRHRLESARNEEEFQTVGLLCREAMISLAQAVYDPTLHLSSDGTSPGPTDGKRMLENYIAIELKGGSNETSRRLTKAALDMANELQHRRTATFRDAALCSEATRTVVNIIALISGRRSQ